MSSEAKWEIAQTDAPNPQSHINAHTYVHTQLYTRGDISRSSMQAFSFPENWKLIMKSFLSRTDLVSTVTEVGSYGVKVNEERELS